MLILTILILFCQNLAVLLQYSADFTTDSSTENPDTSPLFTNLDFEISSSTYKNFDFERSTTIETPNEDPTFENLENEVTTTIGFPIKCTPNFDNLKVIPDKVSMDAYLTWDSNNTDACDYKYKVTTKTISLERMMSKSEYVTGQNYTIKNIRPCVKYNFTVELQQQSDDKTLFAKSDILETDIPEDDKVNNVTYLATTDSIFLNWVPSPNAKACKIQYRITYDLLNPMPNIPYFRLEPNSKHVIRDLYSCTYYNVTIRSSDLREDGEKDKDPMMYVISTLPEHVNDLTLNVSGNYSRLTWNPPSNQECLKSYNITITNFTVTTFDTHFETNQNLFCTKIVINPISKDNGVGKPATILKPGLVQNVTSYLISHEEVIIYWDPPINTTCVDGYLIKVTNHLKKYIDKNTGNFTIKNLTACTTYEIKLYAVTNRTDLGDPYILYTNTSEPNANDLHPVENLTRTVDDKIVTLNWNPPSNAKTCNLTYLVKVHDGNGEEFLKNQTSETTQMFNFTGAIYCSHYIVSVRTVTQSAYSDPNELFIEIPEVRTAPTCTAENVNTTRAVVKCEFEDFTTNLCPIEKLTVTCNGTNRVAQNLNNPNEVKVTFEDLHAYSQYECTAAVDASSGKSPLSNPVGFRTMEGVPDPLQVNVMATYPNTFSFDWKEVEKLRGAFKNYHIRVESINSTYFIPSECQRDEIKIFQHDEFSINKTDFQFSQAFPSYKYEVTVKAATGAGYGSPSNSLYIFTKGGIPEEPRNTSFTLHNFTREKDYNVSVILNWDYPCFTNGNVSHFHIAIVGKSYVGDQIDNHEVEKNVSVNVPITDLNYDYTLTNLKPAFLYNIAIQVVAEDNLKSNPEILNFTSYESFPEAPTVKRISQVTEKTFTIEWDKPKMKRGKLRKYVVHVESVKPSYKLPAECVVHGKNDTDEVPENENSFTYRKGTPYHTYHVYVTAVNKIGSSPLSEVLVTETLEAEPEQVRNLKVTLEDSQTEEYYNATAKVIFDHPCHTYGDIRGIDVNVNEEGTRDWSNRSINVISDRYEETFTDLLPERRYFLFVQVHTKTYKSKATTKAFTTAAGIPLLRKPILSPVPQESGTAMFTLSKDIFDERNGNILFYAVILGEVGNNEKSMFGKLRYSNDWPELAENSTANDKVKPYQVTPEHWNPFEDNDLTNVTITLGDNSYEGNKPLVQSVTYTIKVRGFTNNGYRDSPTVTFKIPEEKKLGLILGLTFGIMGTCAIFFLIFIIWKKRQKWTKKKESIKSIPLVPIPISISNFSHYYSDLQDNGEKLKLEFSLLASKSGEIVANFCEATLPENKKKNRYTNILPYDESRVKLLPQNEEEELMEDYINASYVKGYSGSIEYIATQGPLEHTVMDFWKMVTQENSSLIVMVAQFVEQNKDKCYKYFPNVHENIELDNGIAIRCCSELNFKNYVVRTFMVQKETQQWTVTHLQFTDWPDFGCPTGTEVIIEFCQLMRDHAGRNQDPIIIHCSAGVGRTGTLIALDILLQAISSKSDIDIFGTVLNLRRDRKNMVQTEKQYLFIHNCVDDVIQNPTCISIEEEMFSKEPIYENLNGINNGQLDDHMQESKF